MEQSKHSDGVTSVKVHHQPGGASTFSIGGNYGGDEDRFGAKTRVPEVAKTAEQEEEEKKEEEAKAAAVATP